MSLVFGKRTAGRIYITPHDLIATVFFHVWFIPVCPLSGILVTKNGFFREQGTPIPLSKRSVMAAYSRIVPIPILFLATGAIYSSLFIDKEIPFVATTIFLVSTMLWLYFLLVFGSKPCPGFIFTRSKLGLIAGISIAATFVISLFVLAPPRSRPALTIANDFSIADDVALEEITRSVFGEKVTIRMTQANSGIELKIETWRISNPSTRSEPLGRALANIANEILLVRGLQETIRHGQTRRLTRIDATYQVRTIAGRIVKQDLDVTITQEQFAESLDYQWAAKPKRFPAWTINADNR